MIVTGTFAKLLAPGIFYLFNNKYEEVALIGDSLFNTESSNRKSIDSYGVTGFGAPEVVREAEEFPMSDAKPTPGRTVEATKYGLGYEITYEMLKFDQYGVVKQLPEMLADAMRQYRETLAVDVFVTGGVTTKRTTPDGQALFSANHVVERTGATTSNLLGGAVGSGPALSTTSLQDGLMLFRRQKNSEGRTMRSRPAVLLIGPALEFTARTILGSTNVIGSNNNDINVVAQEGLQIVIWPALDDNAVTRNAWFLLSDKAARRIFKFEPDGLDHKVWDENKRDVTIHRAKYMLTYDFWDWRNMVASYPPAV